jgi:hypothetical protein
MKTLAKIALAASVLAGAAVATTTAADARVFVGVGVGPGYYGGPAYYPRYSCDPYSRWYDPYRCRRYYYDDYYDYGPDYYGPAYYGPAIGFGFGFGGGHGHWGHGGHWGGHHH